MSDLERGGAVLRKFGITRRTILGTSFAVPLFACGAGHHELSSLVEGETGRIVDVRDGDALILDTGLSVRLAEIEAPRRKWKARPADPHGEEAAQLLEELSLGRKTTLYYGGLTRDKYDRAIAHLRVWDETGEAFWLNGEIVRKGGARVRSWADNSAMVRQLYEKEEAARQSEQGLWALSEYQILQVVDLERAAKGMKLVEGDIRRVSEASQADSYASPSSDGGFNLTLGYRLARSNERLRLGLADKIRIRGWHGAYADRTPSIRLDHWGQVEVLTKA